MNTIIITGTVKGEVKGDGTKGEFSLVNVEKIPTQDGKGRKQFNYFDVVGYGVWANWIPQYLKDGTKLVVKGSLRHFRGEYNGRKYNKVKIILENLEFMSNKQ